METTMKTIRELTHERREVWIKAAGWQQAHRWIEEDPDSGRVYYCAQERTLLLAGLPIEDRDVTFTDLLDDSDCE